MTDIGESVNVIVHTEPTQNCPFCPEEKKDNYKTYPGKANNSKKLALIMDDPSSLTSEQSGARAKDGKSGNQSPSAKQPVPAPIYSHSDYGEYSAEAHHCISGNQAMKGEKIEDWICKSKGKVTADSGYSINNADNGVWLPSIPEETKGGKWGGMKYERKYEIARLAMDAGKGQFHKGPHDITDPEDPYGKYHLSYKDYLKNGLSEIHDRINLWAEGCYMCEEVDKENGPFTVNVTVNVMLDRFSRAMKGKLVGPPSGWKCFISKIAMDYHKKGYCKHKKRSI